VQAGINEKLAVFDGKFDQLFALFQQTLPAAAAVAADADAAVSADESASAVESEE
jgi:hypothetical protein